MDIKANEGRELSWLDAEALAHVFGPKGARLLALPKDWTPPFFLVSADLTGRIVGGAVPSAEVEQLMTCLRSLWGEQGVIVRSSVIGETIWDRGTFDSIRLCQDDELWAGFTNAVNKVAVSAQGRQVALVVQEYIPSHEHGEFGNLNRVSKTRDHWQYSVTGEDPVHQNQRYNSQRDIEPNTRAILTAKKGLSKERLFGSISAWINNSLLRGHTLRVNCEWVRYADRFYVVQIDGEDEDVSGLNPLQAFIPPAIPTGGSGSYLRQATKSDRTQWDKLAVLDQLFEPTDPIEPVLFILNVGDATADNESGLCQDFEELIGSEVVVRVSVRAGSEKIPNLPKTDCETPLGAAQWCINAAVRLAEKYNDREFAFVAHRFIAARSSAWARATPDDPVVEIHGTWGLPDGLQFCPYDIWDVHVPSEEINEYPAYKSDILVKQDNGLWSYQRVKNEVARFQSMLRHQVLDVASRTKRIAEKLNRPCHVMWFVGCTTDEGADANIPWYWTEAHDVPLPAKRSTHQFKVEKGDDLDAIEGLSARYPGLGIVLSARAEELLRSREFLAKVAAATVPKRIPIILEGSALAHAYFQLQKHRCVVISAGDREHVRTRKQMTFGKLVRDKIPDKIEAQKERQSVAVIPDKYRLGYLVGKLLEEGIEVRESGRSSPSRLTELADVYEVLRALVSISELEMTDIVRAADIKRDNSGGFDGARLLLETSIPGPSSTSAPPRGVSVSEHGGLLVEHHEGGVLRLPFTFFGFSPLDQAKAVSVPEFGLVAYVQLKRDCIEISFNRDASQLELPV